MSGFVLEENSRFDGIVAPGLQHLRMIRRQVRFIGRVQGVGFRATTHTIARQYAVTGWVRNEDDGSVLLEVQGTKSVTEKFLTHIHQVLGRFITSHTSAEITLVSEESDFGIRR